MAKKKDRLNELEKKSQNQDFWLNKERAAEITRELNFLKEEIEDFAKLKKELLDLKELSEIPNLENEIEKKIEEIEKELKKREIKIFLSGKYDKGDAILSITANVGGQDSQDWAVMLLRMYEKYCFSKGFQIKILHQSFGNGVGPEGRIGIKSAVLEIKGFYAYGFLKKENGVHRLVRLSPFSANVLRHTSFVFVEVIPKIEQSDKEIKIRPEEIKLETFRAGGPGGQYVNRRESAVRLTHLPTGVVVACQSERLQGLNKQKAMEVLSAKLYQLKLLEKEKELKKIKMDQKMGQKGKNQNSANWGNQIRNYVFHPYKLVKDLRTGVETSRVEEVLDGNLDEFIEAEIKLK